MLSQGEIDNLKAKAASCVARVNALVADSGPPPLPPPPPPTGETVALDAATRFQTIAQWYCTSRGWETSKTTNNYDPTWAANCVAVANKLVNELGVNGQQIGIASGYMNPVNYWSQFVSGAIDASGLGAHLYEKLLGSPTQFAQFDFQCDTMLVPMRDAMAARGEALYASLLFVDFYGATSNFAFSQNASAYAAFVMQFVNRMQSRCGVTVDAIDVVLEPDNVDPANTKPWTPTAIGNAMVALRAALNAGGFPNVKLIAPSVTNQGNAVSFLNGIKAVPGALAALDVAAYHRYQSGDIAAIRAWAVANGKSTAMSELFGATIDTLIDDLLTGQVSHWQKYGMAGRLGGSTHSYYIVDPVAQTYAFAPDVAWLSLIFPYVRRGAQRIAATSSAGMKVVAFQNANGKRVVHCNRTQAAASVTITGLAPGAYGVRFIPAASGNAANGPDVTANASGAAVVPLAPGNTTIYAR